MQKTFVARQWLFWGLGCIVVCYCANLLLSCTREVVRRYQVSVIPTPTPHYQPMSGNAYVVSNTDLLAGPDLKTWAQDWGGKGSQVEILQAQWYYIYTSHGERACYIYRIRLPSGDESKWLEQDELTQIPGSPLPRDQVCYPEGYPDHSPLLGIRWDWTNVGPNRRETPGWGYVNVGEGQGATVFFAANPMVSTSIRNPLVRHGLQLEIWEAHWYSQGNNGCYMYQIRDPESGVEGWLPEDVLSPDLSQSPPEHCLLFVDREWIVKPVQPQ